MLNGFVISLEKCSFKQANKHTVAQIQLGLIVVSSFSQRTSRHQNLIANLETVTLRTRSLDTLDNSQELHENREREVQQYFDETVQSKLSGCIEVRLL